MHVLGDTAVRLYGPGAMLFKVDAGAGVSVDDVYGVQMTLISLRKLQVVHALSQVTSMTTSCWVS